MAAVIADLSPSFTEVGFNDWKHVTELLRKHEQSKGHSQALVAFSIRQKKASHLYSQLSNQLENEKKYWRSVLKRIVEVVKFLVVRSLAFWGSNEKFGSFSKLELFGKSEAISQI